MLKKYWPLSLVSFLIFWRLGDDSLNSLWMSRWCALLVMLSIVITVQVGRRVSWWVTPALFSSLFSGVVTTFWFQKYRLEPFEVQSAIRQSSAMALAALIIPIFFLLFLRKDDAKTFRLSFTAMGVLTSFIVFGVKLAGRDPASQIPLFDNASMTGSFIVVTLFLCLDLSLRWKAFVWGVGIPAILLTQATTPLVALLAGLSVIGLKSYKYGRTAFWLLISVGLTMGLLQPLHMWFENRGRLGIWLQAWNWFKEQTFSFTFMGAGIGTTRVIVPIIQAHNGMDPEYGQWYLWLHNDWFQILLEQGYLGAVCALITGLGALYVARTRMYLLAAVLSFYGTMLTNFPLHWPVHAFLGAIIMRFCFYKETEGDGYA